MISTVVNFTSSAWLFAITPYDRDIKRKVAYPLGSWSEEEDDILRAGLVKHGRGWAKVGGQNEKEKEKNNM